jgi:hypothetical protein
MEQQKANILTNKWAMELNRHFSNEEMQMAINTRKNVQHP